MPSRLVLLRAPESFEYYNQIFAQFILSSVLSRTSRNWTTESMLFHSSFMNKRYIGAVLNICIIIWCRRGKKYFLLSNNWSLKKQDLGSSKIIARTYVRILQIFIVKSKKLLWFLLILLFILVIFLTVTDNVVPNPLVWQLLLPHQEQSPHPPIEI